MLNWLFSMPKGGYVTHSQYHTPAMTFDDSIDCIDIRSMPDLPSYPDTDDKMFYLSDGSVVHERHLSEEQKARFRQDVQSANNEDCPDTARLDHLTDAMDQTMIRETWGDHMEYSLDDGDTWHGSLRAAIDADRTLKSEKTGTHVVLKGETYDRITRLLGDAAAMTDENGTLNKPLAKIVSDYAETLLTIINDNTNP